MVGFAYGVNGSVSVVLFVCFQENMGDEHKVEGELFVASKLLLCVFGLSSIALCLLLCV